MSKECKILDVRKEILKIKIKNSELVIEYLRAKDNSSREKVLNAIDKNIDKIDEVIIKYFGEK